MSLGHTEENLGHMIRRRIGTETENLKKSCHGYFTLYCVYSFPSHLTSTPSKTLPSAGTEMKGDILGARFATIQMIVKAALCTVTSLSSFQKDSVFNWM